MPGISKNGRRYTKEAIAKAVARLSERIAHGADPAVMLTSHGADDDSRRIVGLLDSVSLTEDGSARFTAQIADTDEGRKIASLVDTRGGPAFLKGVSIRGRWLGKTSRGVSSDGVPYEEAPDLEIEGLDFTRKPGVPGAQIDTFTPASPGATAEAQDDGRAFITESVEEALVTAISEDDGAPAHLKSISEADASSSKQPYGDVQYADPGYQKDKKKRYPLDSKAHAKAAWSYVNQADNARLYTSAQLKRIKQRVVKALKGYGVTVATQERWLVEPATQVTEALAECWGMESPEGTLYLSLTNGPTTVSISSSVLDAHDLDLVGRAAMAGACDALMALDPDMDADIDVPGAEPEDTDHGMDDGDEEPEDNAPGSACPCGCGCAVPHPMAIADGCPCGCGCQVCHATDNDAEDEPTAAESAPIETPAPVPAAENPTQEKEPAMAESTTPAAETPGTDSGIDALSAKFDKLTDAITGLVTSLAPKPAAAESAPAPVAVESAPAPAPVAETEDQRIERLVAERLAAALPTAVQEHVERQGPPARKGLVAPVSESSPAAAGAEPGLNQYGFPADWPNKPAHEFTPDERAQFFGPALRQHVLKDRFRG